LTGQNTALRERDVPEQARRHHVVSKFYLRHFADEREQLTTVLLPGDQG
jgi:hypothetical protein